MVYVTKRIEFSAAHRLHNPAFSEEENLRIYDKCNNLHGHGHNYVLEVTVAGEPDPDTGYVIDLKKLKAILIEELISQVDHKHFNFDVGFMTGTIPTVENIIAAFWRVLENKIPNGRLYKLKLWETENSYAEYFG